MTRCWSCRSDIGGLYKICPICLTMLDEIACYKCGRYETNVCTTPGHMYGKPLWIESESEDEEGNWDGNYLCHECWLKIYDHNINPCCMCGKNETKLDLAGKPIWYLDYDEKGEWTEKYRCHYCHNKKYGHDIDEYNNEDDEEIKEKDEELGEYKKEDKKEDKIDLNSIDHHNIRSCRQNIPELIIRDCIREFNFDEKQAERMRMILLVRGVNKWFFVRREFIRLKHQVKEMLKSTEYPYNDKKVHRIVEKIYVRMQNIAKLPRWIWWPITITHKWKKIEEKIIIKGRYN